MSTPNRKRTAREVLDAIEKPSPDEEIERALAKTGAEATKELLDAGYGEDELDAMDDALLAGHPEVAEPAAAPPPAKVIPFRVRAPSRWSRVAAAAAVLGPVGYLTLTELAEPLTMVAAGPDGGAALVQAESIRSEAASALEAGQWARCLALLDEARQMDPEGDKLPAVVSARRIAMTKLGRLDAGAP